MQPDRFGVFSPGDLCPDNNLLTAGGVRLLDFEAAGIYSVFLDAAYIRMPFSTCWCVFRLPADLSEDAEAAYRQQVSAVLPQLADDAGLGRGPAAWRRCLDDELDALAAAGRAAGGPATG